MFVLRADNKGEGGILALMALAFPERRPGANRSRLVAVMLGLGIFGAALLYGDGMITPAVSVLGAVEGLDVATPKMLEALGKPFGQDEIKIALKAARDAGLPFVLYMLFGGPGETWADVQDTQSFLNGCAPANAVFASFGIRIYEGTTLAGIARQQGVLTSDQDLFNPAYYLSTAMVERTVENLDRISRQRAEWTSPADWRRPMMLWAQKVMVLLKVRPQWKYIQGYGQHMRRWLK